MGSSYKKEPNNFIKIKDILCIEDECILRIFLSATELYFYDTCSLQCHSNSNNSGKIAEYIKLNDGAVVITQTVLSELGGIEGNIDESVIRYLHYIKSIGIDIVLFKEEKLLYILRECIDQTYAECNKDLAYAIGEVSSATKGTIESIDNELQFKKSIFSNTSSSKEIFGNFFEQVLYRKSSGDDLGEETMFICFIILSKIQVVNKLIFLSNDLKSRYAMCSIIKYTNQRYSKEPYQLTSSTLFYKLVKYNLITTKQELIELVSKSTKNNNINIYYTDKYSIDVRQASFKIDEYVEKVFTENEFNVLY